MRFSTTTESLGVSLLDSVMTLIAFLPVLVRLSADITEVPLLGAIPYPLVVAALLWSVFGTGFLALVGIKLPGLEFRNQRVEAAYRKELVYGEDDAGARRPADGRASSSPTCGATTSASISTTCISTSPASSTCRSTTSSAT